MRLWSIHPKYLDAKGLVALWREGLLALNVLQGKTKGYKNHPQLIRFILLKNPVEAISLYLYAVLLESKKRGYRFDQNKIRKMLQPDIQIQVTKKQILYEWELLKRKIYCRDERLFSKLTSIEFPEAHPMFKMVNGEIEEWEKIKS